MAYPLPQRHDGPADRETHSIRPVDRAPERGVYVYFRNDEAKTVMMALNFSKEDKSLDTKRFAERMSGSAMASYVLTREMGTDLATLTLGRNSPLVLELER